MLQILATSLGAGIAARMGAAAVGAAMLVGTAVAQEPRPAEVSIVEDFNAGQLKTLHAVLVIWQGETLAELYFDGSDQERGRRLGVVHHGPDTLHDIRSITKSVTALLYGIALAEGKVPGLEALLLAQFPEYADLAGDPLRDRISVGDTLAMKMGTKQYEDLFVMENSDRFVLERPMVAVPGTRWSYSGGPAVLIGKLIEDGTGMALDDYGRDRLFQPLGITHWYWARRPDGVPSAASGLRMTARDLAKIGQMVLDGGMFDGRQVVPRGWLDELFPPRRARRTISSLSAACQQPFS